MKNIKIENIKRIVGEDIASKIVSWWNNREVVLALNIVPGASELTLLRSICELTQAPVYKLECSKFTSKIELHSLLKESLNDANEDVIVLIEKVEEVSNQESFQTLILEFLEQGFITEPDLTTTAPKSGKFPHLIIVSNQKTEKAERLLYRPIARRSILAQLAN